MTVCLASASIYALDPATCTSIFGIYTHTSLYLFCSLKGISSLCHVLHWCKDLTDITEEADAFFIKT